MALLVVLTLHLSPSADGLPLEGQNDVVFIALLLLGWLLVRAITAQQERLLDEVCHIFGEHLA